VRDSGHFAYAEMGREAALRFRGDFAAQYDQAGLMLRVDAETWIKAGIERADGRDWLSVVVTRGLSDWSQQPAPPPDADGWWSIRAVREGDAVQLLAGDQPIRLAPLPPEATVLAGPMCAAPEGPGFTARFAT
jgi:regulation of enolase protein 1 (concanavalin A-like superfamily)